MKDGNRMKILLRVLLWLTAILLGSIGLLFILMAVFSMPRAIVLPPIGMICILTILSGAVVYTMHTTADY